jgi:FMN phosphatase YigB (HAD superfamily)
MERRKSTRNPSIEERKKIFFNENSGLYVLTSVEATPLTRDREITRLAIDVDGTAQPDHGTTDWGKFGKLGGAIFAAFVGVRIFGEALFWETEEFEKKALARLKRQGTNLKNIDLKNFAIDQVEDFEWFAEELEKAVSPTTWGRFIEKARISSATLPVETVQKLREMKSNGLVLTLATDTRFERARISMLKALYSDVFGDVDVWTIGTTGKKKSHPNYPAVISQKLGVKELQKTVLADDLAHNLKPAQDAGMAIAKIRNSCDPKRTWSFNNLIGA